MSSRRKRVDLLFTNIKTTEKGLSTEEKKATLCSTPSSQRRKSSFRRFGMYLPSRSITLTGKVTSVVLTRITSPASTSSGPAGGAGDLAAGRVPGVRVAPPKTGGRVGVDELGAGGVLCPIRR